MRQTGSSLFPFDLSRSIEPNADNAIWKTIGDLVGIGGFSFAPFQRYRRINADYVMTKTSSYKNILLCKNWYFLALDAPYHISENCLDRGDNEYFWPP